MAFARRCDLCKKFYDHTSEEETIKIGCNKFSHLNICDGNSYVLRRVDLCKKCFDKTFKNLDQEGETK